MADKMNYGDCAFYPIPAVNRLIKEGNEDIASQVSTLETSVSTIEDSIDTLEDSIDALEAHVEYNKATAFMPVSELNTITPTAGENYSSFGNSFYYKKGSKVHVHLGLYQLTVNSGNVVFTLPEGYRPSYQLGFIGQGQTATTVSGIVVSTSGAITVYGSTAYCNTDFEFDVVKE